MISCSHWGMFYRNQPRPISFWHSQQRYKPTSFFVSRQDRSFPEYVNADNGGDTTIYQKQNFGRELP